MGALSPQVARLVRALHPLHFLSGALRLTALTVQKKRPTFVGRREYSPYHLGEVNSAQ
jgi:hypothetical protein